MSKKNLQKDFRSPKNSGLVLRIKTNSAHDRYFEKGHGFNFQKIAETWFDLLCKIKAPAGTYLFYLHEITERVPDSKSLVFNKYGPTVKSYFWKLENGIDNFCGTLSASFMNKEDFDILYLGLKSVQDGESKTFDQIKTENSQKKHETEPAKKSVHADSTGLPDYEQMLKMNPLDVFLLLKQDIAMFRELYVKFSEIIPNAFSKDTLVFLGSKPADIICQNLLKEFTYFVGKDSKIPFYFGKLLINFLADPEKFNRDILSDKATLFISQVKKIWQNKYIPKNRKYKWTRLKELDFEKLFQEYFLPMEKELEFRDLYFEVGHQDLMTAHKAKVAENLERVKVLELNLAKEEDRLKANKLCIQTAEALLNQQKNAGAAISLVIKEKRAEMAKLLVE